MCGVQKEDAGTQGTLFCLGGTWMLFSFVKSTALSESLQSTYVCKYYLCTSLTLSNAFNATYKKCGKTEVEKEEWLALV